MKPRCDSTEIRGRLALAGYRSITAWANAHGYKPVTVRRTIYEWANRTDREPVGRLGWQILTDLRMTLEELEAV